jgi:hypothetical protein
VEICHSPLRPSSGCESVWSSDADRHDKQLICNARPGSHASAYSQHMIDGLLHQAVAPRIEISLHHGVGREVLGQQAPLAAGLRDI